MLKMVDGTGIIGVDMICPLGVSTPQPPNYDRVELEGTGMLVLPNSLDAPLERLELGGKTEQVQTSGKQLFDASRYEGVTKNGVTVTVKDGVITATGTANINTWIQVFVSRENYQKLFKPENKIYLKTNKSKDCNYDFGIYGVFGSPIVGTIREGNSGNVLPAELPRNDTDFYFFIDVKIGVELKGSIKPIVYHDGDGTWEPYTGSKPSPSPEYPQEIKNSGKWNEEKQKYEVDVKVTGKNLFDVNYFTKNENYQNKDGDATHWKYATLKVEPNTTYTASKGLVSKVNGGINNDFNFAGALFFYNDTKSVKITSKDNGILYVMLYNRNEDANILKEMDIQVELGEKLTEYQPYQEQTLTLTSDRPITKWDRLVEQGGQIGWLYQSKIAYLTGEEEWKSSLNAFYTTTYNFIKNNAAKCNHYVLGGITNQEKNNIFSIGDGAYTNSLWIRDTSFSSVQDFKAHLSDLNEKSDPIMVVSPAAQTEFVPLPQSEQNAIRALRTYYPTTVITVDGGELDPDIKITYRKEI